jgi:hypothetical protein
VAKGFKSGGRRAGTPNRATVERAARARAGVEAALATGPMPLDVILTVMRGGPEAEAITDRQYEAAVAAAPYLHPKLSSTTLDATLRADPASLTDAQLAAIVALADAGGPGDAAPASDAAGSADLVH